MSSSSSIDAVLHCLWQCHLGVCSEGFPQTEGFQSSPLDQVIVRRSVLQYLKILHLKYKHQPYQPASPLCNFLFRGHRLPAAGSRSLPQGATEKGKLRGGAAAGAAAGSSAGQQVPAERYLLGRRRRLHGVGQQLTHRQV